MVGLLTELLLLFIEILKYIVLLINELIVELATIAKIEVELKNDKDPNKVWWLVVALVIRKLLVNKYVSEIFEEFEKFGRIVLKNVDETFVIELTDWVLTISVIILDAIVWLLNKEVLVLFEMTVVKVPVEFVKEFMVAVKVKFNKAILVGDTVRLLSVVV